MARLDWKRGRFSLTYEQDQMDAALRGRQDEIGDSVNWYRFDKADSVMDDIYDEGVGIGRVYKGPFPVPMMHVVHDEGPNENGDGGFYYNDSVHATASFDQLRRRAGFQFVDIDHQLYLKDRLVYDDRVFRITRLSIIGQVNRRDVIVSIDATQVKSEELVNDAQFRDWSA
jgi:hypothetical protein